MISTIKTATAIATTKAITISGIKAAALKIAREDTRVEVITNGIKSIIGTRDGADDRWNWRVIETATMGQIADVVEDAISNDPEKFCAVMNSIDLGTYSELDDLSDPVDDEDRNLYGEICNLLENQGNLTEIAMPSHDCEASGFLGQSWAAGEYEAITGEDEPVQGVSYNDMLDLGCRWQVETYDATDVARYVWNQSDWADGKVPEDEDDLNDLADILNEINTILSNIEHASDHLPYRAEDLPNGDDDADDGEGIFSYSADGLHRLWADGSEDWAVEARDND